MTPRSTPIVKYGSCERCRPGFWRRLSRRLGGQRCNDLLATGRVLEKLRLEDRQDLGLKRVPLDRIVGSTGRHREFDLTFKPRHLVSEERWRRVAQLVDGPSRVPPVLLYKVGDAYFVEDGNHRISVARSRNLADIEAQVIELDPSPLALEPGCTRLGYKV